MGLPETSYPTEKYHYSGCMTIPKELHIKDEKLYQVPVKEMESLRKNCRPLNEQLTNGTVAHKLKTMSNEIDLTVNLRDSNALMIDLFADELDEKRFRLILNRKKNEIMIDRSQSGMEVSSEYGVTRKIDYELPEKLNLRIYTDSSSIEVFINNGEKVFTSRIFPNEDQIHMFLHSICGTTNINGSIYEMK